MADEIKFEADFSELYAAKRWLQVYVGKMVTQLVNTTSLALQRHIKQDLFSSYSGGVAGKGIVYSRSGELKRNITAIPATTDGETVSGGINIGTIYNRVIFGKAGQVTHIVPKNAQALTIPLPAAMNSNGTARGSARDKAIFGETFIAKGIIFGKLNYVRGKKAGQTKGDIVPLFVLKKSVDVPVQITSESLRDWVQPILGKGMADIAQGLSEASFA